MKTLRIALLGLALATGLVPGADAHGPRVGVSIALGYPAYVAPPVYYVPPPAVYVPPPPPVYAAPPFVVAPYRYPGYGYYPFYDYRPRPGWHRHGRYRDD